MRRLFSIGVTVKIKTNRISKISIVRIMVAAAILLLLTLYLALPAVHLRVAGWAMVYTQRSAQAVAGAIQGSAHLSALSALGLSGFQTIALPWLLPYGIVGNVLAFGSLTGVLLSLLGAGIGASVWFGLARLFLGETLLKNPGVLAKSSRWIGFCAVAALNWLTLGMLFIPAAFAGTLQMPCRRFLLVAILAELPIVALYAAFGTPYRVLLPNSVEAVIRFLGATMAFVALAIGLFAWKKHRTAQQDEEVSNSSES
jgi:uncharacterized membrane protein YdjX (TVP38/TMEM64 family)